MRIGKGPVPKCHYFKGDMLRLYILINHATGRTKLSCLVICKKYHKIVIKEDTARRSREKNY